MNLELSDMQQLSPSLGESDGDKRDSSEIKYRRSLRLSYLAV